MGVFKINQSFQRKNQELGWDRGAAYDWPVDLPVEDGGKERGGLHKPNYC